MSKTQFAIDTFNNNFNCAQAVLTAFSDELGLDKVTALKVSTCFGGGMRCGEVCGAVTGALMAIGMKYGHYISDDIESKNNAYSKTSEFSNEFIAKNDSIICKKLLCYDLSQPEDLQKIKEQNLFRTICPKMISDAVEILEKIL